MGVIMQAFYWNCPGNEGRDGNWWNFLNGKVKDFEAVGFTALWLPPANKAAEAQSMGYDPYDYYDLGDFNQKGGTKTWFGNKAELMSTGAPPRGFTPDSQNETKPAQHVIECAGLDPSIAL